MYSLQVQWRLGPRSQDILPLDLYGAVESSDQDTYSCLTSSDFVVSMPSTVTLEAMACDVPTCCINYSNGPELVQAAWNIRSSELICNELKSLFSRDHRRLLYQRYLLHDQMRLDSPASPRVAMLMKEMVEKSKGHQDTSAQNRLSSTHLSVPCYNHNVHYDYRPERLFPAHPLFARDDSDHLASELSNLRIYSRYLESLLNVASVRKILLGRIVKLLKRCHFKVRRFS
jgi:hypothetical protein